MPKPLFPKGAEPLAAWFLSCEHAGYEIPFWLEKSMAIPKDILKSHRGWDIGAWQVAKHLSEALKLPLFGYPYTRLLVEANRSLGHPNFFSSFSCTLDTALKARCLNYLYYPFRKRVRDWIQGHQLGMDVVHLSIHSFTPVLDGQKRHADIGILFDPSKEKERALAMEMKHALRGSGFKCRLNYPYLGTSDGHTTALRKIFKERYVGLEIEINQALISDKQGILKTSHDLVELWKGLIYV